MAGVHLSGVATANPADTTRRDVLVALFLRGGCDALNLVAPASDDNYIQARPTLRIRTDGATPGLALANPLGGIDFRLHPQAAALKELYDSGVLAVVHACGLTNGTRSHFDAMDFMERGTPTNKTTASGWLARHLASIGANGTGSVSLPAVSLGSSTPESLLGSAAAISMWNPNNFGISGGDGWLHSDQTARLNELYNGTTTVHEAGKRVLDTIDVLRGRRGQEGTGYPGGPLSDALRNLAQVIDLGLGLQVATVDFGGWDTHEGQGWHFGNLVQAVGTSLQAFYNDLVRRNQANNVTLVVMSEFGRRLKENDSDGTDHGHGGVMLVLGGNVNGGKMYGQWPGLGKDQLDNSVDLAVTTDYRTVLSEILVRRNANPKLGTIFPGIDAKVYGDSTRLNLVRGEDLPIDYSASPVFSGNGRVYLPLVRR
jgi:uncharacterized protein (DUF1501 family)